MTDRAPRPSIFQIGMVLDMGDVIVIRGWGLGWCAAHCDCHLDPDTGQLALADAPGYGRLGLISHQPDCTCCQPWTHHELAAILRDLAQVRVTADPRRLAS